MPGSNLAVTGGLGGGVGVPTGNGVLVLFKVDKVIGFNNLRYNDSFVNRNYNIGQTRPK